MNSMMEGSSSQQNICVRRQSCRSIGKGPGKEDASLSKAVDVRRFGILASVTAQPVGSQSINSDEEQILLWFFPSQRKKKRDTENRTEKEREKDRKK